jgi:tRNA threonylcarbamoyladenosine biosynthesis protein TsaB
VILGMDTATPSTAVALLAPGGRTIERRDDPGPGERPRHAGRLLVLVEEVLAEAGIGWDEVTRLAVGLGPGGFTGLRIGIATARGLAQANGIPLAGVSTLDALAAPHRGDSVLAVLDARRGEVFLAGYVPDGTRVIEPVALPPDGLAAAAAKLPAGALAVGDGALRFRADLEGAGVAVPPDEDPVHRVSAVQVCRLAAHAPPADRDALLPEYVREPDAKPPAQP